MKIIVEISDKVIEMAKIALLMDDSDANEQADDLAETFDRLKAHTEPLELKLNNTEDSDFTFALIYVAAMKLEELSDETDEP